MKVSDSGEGSKEDKDDEGDGDEMTHMSHSEDSEDDAEILENEQARDRIVRMQTAMREQAFDLFVPEEKTIELLTIRRMLTNLRSQTGPPLAPGVHDDSIPIQTFQRTFNRFFYIVRDRTSIQAGDYDRANCGYIGWRGFYALWRERQVILKLNMFERLWLCLDDPTSCKVATAFYVVTALVILISGLLLSISTIPSLKARANLDSEGDIHIGFWVFELVTMIYLCTVYIFRLVAVLGIRFEVLDEDHLMTEACGYTKIRLSNPVTNIIFYIFSPWHIIDLMTVVPGLVYLTSGEVMKNYESLVLVFRVMYFLRLLRLLSDTKWADPVYVMKRTVIKSAKVLYVLGFNLVGGVLVSASLIYLTEKGTFNADTGTYMRVVGKVYNKTTGATQDLHAESPFQSMPQAIWWALINSLTVGASTGHASTSMGTLVTMGTMAWSLIIIALGVGMVGGTFTQVWNQYIDEKIARDKMYRKEMRDVSAAVHKVTPEKVAPLMMIEVWHDDGTTDSSREVTLDNYLGEACFSLPLNETQVVQTEMKVKLKADPQKVSRRITGHVTIKIDWCPDLDLSKNISISSRPLSIGTRNSSSKIRRSLELAKMQSSGTEILEHATTRALSFAGHGTVLQGDLMLTICGAEGLGKIDWAKKGGVSSPYVVVYCNPKSPKDSERLSLYKWRTSSVVDSLNPSWEENHKIQYRWTAGSVRKTISPIRKTVSRASTASEKEKQQLGGSMSPDTLEMIQELSRNVLSMTADIQQVKSEVRSLSSRVQELTGAGPRGNSEDEGLRQRSGGSSKGSSGGKADGLTQGFSGVLPGGMVP